MKLNQLDFNNYKEIYLSNGIKAVLVQNNRLSNFSCAVSVSTDISTEPRKYRGISSLLARMLLLNDEAFQGIEGGMDSLYSNGASIRLLPKDKHAIFYCESNINIAWRLLSILVRLLTCPSFSKTNISKAALAETSEYFDSLKTHENRINAALEDIVAFEDIRKRENLWNLAQYIGDEDLEAIKKIWETQYCAENVKIVICGSADIKVLESLASAFEIFKKRKKMNSPLYLNKVSPLDSKYFGNLIKTASVDGRRELQIVIDIDVVQGEYCTQFLECIITLLEMKSADWLIATLKDRGFAYDLRSDYNYKFGFTRVNIYLFLTQKGLLFINEILTIVAAALKNICPDKCDYKRIIKIQQSGLGLTSFDNQMAFTIALAEKIYDFPTNNSFSFGCPLEQFDHALISKIIKQLENTSLWVVILTDPSYILNNIYLVKYEVIGKFVIDQLSTFSPVLAPLIELKFRPIEATKARKGIMKFKSKFGSITYVFDSSILSPDAIASFMVYSEKFITNLYEMKLFFRLAKDQFEEKEASLLLAAHVKLEMDITPEGALIVITSHACKLSKICKLFFSCLRSVKLDRLELFREQEMAQYECSLNDDFFKSLCCLFQLKVLGASPEELDIKILDTLNPDNLSFPVEYNTDVLVVGNLDVKQLRIISSIEKGSKWKSQLPYKSLPPAVCYRISDTSKIAMMRLYPIVEFFEYCLAKEKLYLQKYVIGLLIKRVACKLFTDYIFEKLGLTDCENVKVDTVFAGGVEYFAFAVLAEKQPAEVDKVIKGFILHLYRVIKRMDEQEMKEYKTTFIRDMHSRKGSWREWLYYFQKQRKLGVYDIDHESKVSSVIKSIQRKDLLEASIFDCILVKYLDNIL